MNLVEQIRSLGVHQCSLIAAADVVFSPEVRKMCEVNTCGNYNKTWACPPAIGSYDECVGKCLAYDNALIFTGKYELEDSYDYPGMQLGLKQFKKLARAVGREAKMRLKDFLLLSNEGCDLCESCTYPGAACRFPDLSNGSLEGYGILVSDTAKVAGINYINGQNTMTYFGGLFF